MYMCIFFIQRGYLNSRGLRRFFTGSICTFQASPAAVVAAPLSRQAHGGEESSHIDIGDNPRLEMGKLL